MGLLTHLLGTMGIIGIITKITSARPTLDENHPRYFVKMFTKMILSYTGYSDKIIDFFASADPEIDAGNVKRAGESMLV